MLNPVQVCEAETLKEDTSSRHSSCLSLSQFSQSQRSADPNLRITAGPSAHHPHVNAQLCPYLPSPEGLCSPSPTASPDPVPTSTLPLTIGTATDLNPIPKPPIPSAHHLNADLPPAGRSDWCSGVPRGGPGGAGGLSRIPGGSPLDLSTAPNPGRGVTPFIDPECDADATSNCYSPQAPDHAPPLLVASTPNPDVHSEPATGTASDPYSQQTCRPVHGGTLNPRPQAGIPASTASTGAHTLPDSLPDLAPDPHPRVASGADTASGGVSSGVSLETQQASDTNVSSCSSPHATASPVSPATPPPKQTAPPAFLDSDPTPHPSAIAPPDPSFSPAKRVTLAHDASSISSSTYSSYHSGSTHSSSANSMPDPAAGQASPDASPQESLEHPRGIKPAGSGRKSWAKSWKHASMAQSSMTWSLEGSDSDLLKLLGSSSDEDTAGGIGIRSDSDSDSGSGSGNGTGGGEEEESGGGSGGGSGSGRGTASGSWLGKEGPSESRRQRCSGEGGRAMGDDRAVPSGSDKASGAPPPVDDTAVRQANPEFEL